MNNHVSRLIFKIRKWIRLQFVYKMPSDQFPKDTILGENAEELSYAMTLL